MYSTSKQSYLPSLPQVVDVDIGTTAVEKQGLSPRALRQVLRFIGEHYCDRILLQDLAESACASRFHFSRQFRASTGFSPMEFVLKLRIEAGRTMLATGNQKIATVAACLGFFDQSHFTRTFRRVIGVPPRAFVRQQAQSRATPCFDKARWPQPAGNFRSKASQTVHVMAPVSSSQ